MDCATCAHWGDPTGEEDWQGAEIGFKRCMAVRAYWIIEDAAAGRGEPDAYNETWEARRREGLKASRAYVADGSTYHAELVTGPDFGCVLWTARP